ncbi:MAG TPA: hypothetical protein VML96_10665, partial [Egibacteraceae bacterium]|nr:hypothetical protein [Egibacteraceae bacterium]
GNRFTVELAEDIEPGEYWYYCNLHGPFMSGTITVVDDEEAIPTQQEVAAQAREEIESTARPLLAAYEDAQEGEVDQVWGRPVSPPFAGMAVEEDAVVPTVHAFVSEFIPDTIRVKAGEPVTWTFILGHTVSFQVPEYFSQMTVEGDGTVILNPDAVQPVNCPSCPEPEGPPEGEGGAEGEATATESGEAPPASEETEPPGEQEGPPEPVAVDAGEWDGREFISSGVLWDGTFTLRFTEPGTYPYACLIHPQMVGVVTVE